MTQYFKSNTVKNKGKKGYQLDKSQQLGKSLCELEESSNEEEPDPSMKLQVEGLVFDEAPAERKRETVHIKQLEKEFFVSEQEILEALYYARPL